MKKKKINLKNILKFNLKSLLTFEAFYKIASVIIFTPLFLSAFKLITKISGYTYITIENVVNFLLNPLTIIFLLLLILLLTFYTFIDISTIIIILDASYHNERIGVKEAFLLALKKSLRILNLKNILLPILVIFLIPFLNLGISSGFISTIKVPEFITDYISGNPVFSVLYLGLLIVLTILLFRWLYVMHYFVLEDCDFKEARKKSINLSKKNKIKDFLKIILTEIGVVLFYLVFIFISIVLIILLYKWLGNYSSLSITLIWLFIAFSFAILVIMATPISYGVISLLYYKHKNDMGEVIPKLTVSKRVPIKSNKWFKAFVGTIIVLTIFCGTILTVNVLNGNYDLKIENVKLMEVTAHRGASVKYPENTMAAFKGAKELSADWIELDVQQTKDRELIILHDTNLKRTTGLNKNTWDATLEEVRSLDAGSFFSEEFKGEVIPTLEEVLIFAKNNNIKLNIELKPTGHEVDFEKSVVDLIKKYNLEESSVITSQVYEVLENIKNYAKDVKTVYVMSLAYGDILELECADNFSIEASSINKPLVKKIHNAGKEVYAWTVNTNESINEMINLNVDNIITDNITLAKNLVYESKTSNLVLEYIRLINSVFA